MPITRHSIEVPNPGFTRMTNSHPAMFIEDVSPDSIEALAIKANVEHVQDMLTTGLTEDRIGLDIPGLLRFCEIAGIRIEPLHVVSKEDLSTAAELLKHHNVSSINDALGIYSPYARMSITSRNHDKERLFGPMITERTIAHEMGHSGSEYDAIEFSGGTIPNIVKSASMPRIGNRYNPYAPLGHPMRNTNMTGQFSEEAYAEIFGTSYVHWAYPNGLHAEQNVGYYVNIQGSEVWVPAYYLSIAKQGEDSAVSFSTPTLAAYAFDLFNRIDPEIVPLMNRGRHDIAALEEIDQRLDNMGVQGLATAISQVKYNAGAFLAGLEIAMLTANEKGIPTHPIRESKLPRPDISTRPQLDLECQDDVFVQRSEPIPAAVS